MLTDQRLLFLQIPNCGKHFEILASKVRTPTPWRQHLSSYYLPYICIAIVRWISLLLQMLSIVPLLSLSGIFAELCGNLLSYHRTGADLHCNLNHILEQTSLTFTQHNIVNFALITGSGWVPFEVPWGRTRAHARRGEFHRAISYI